MQSSTGIQQHYIVPVFPSTSGAITAGLNGLCAGLSLVGSAMNWNVQVTSYRRELVSCGRATRIGQYDGDGRWK